MVKRLYTPNEPCDICGTPTIQGPKGVYCWPCWSKWKDTQKSPQTAQAPRNAQLPTQAQIVQPQASGKLIETLEANTRKAFAERDKKIANLTERIEFLESYSTEVKGNKPYIPVKEDAENMDVKNVPF
jgi:uncharacterized Zn finger protein (UPF0148 family)